MNDRFSGMPAGFLALGFILLAVPGAQAEEEEDPEKIETFTVTGSRIQSPSPVSPNPVTEVGAEEVLLQGTARVEDMLRSYPQVYVSQGAGDSNGATGTAMVELRALGPRRTLVLLNGRRMPSGTPTAAAIPDINQIPGPLIERVDIYTGGGAAVYGSDAVAGVVNFLLMDDFEGLRADFQYSEYQHHNDGDHWRELVTASGYPVAEGYKSDGDIARASLIAGFNFDEDRGNLTAYATYRDIEPVLQGSRDYSSCTLDTDLTRCLGSSTIPEGRFTDFGVAGLAASFNPVWGTNFVGGPSFDYLVEGHEFVPREGKTYNYGPANYFQRQDERYTFGAFIRYDLNDHAEAYAEFMYKRDRTTSQIAPSGSFFRTSSILRCDHPFLSQQQRGQISCLDDNGDVIENGEQAVYLGRRNVEGGPRRDKIIHASYRGVAGLRGALNEAWDYDAFVQYAKVEMREAYLNDLSVGRIRRALDVVMHNGQAVCRSTLPDADGAVEDANCVPWNVFEEGAVTSEAVDYLKIPLYSRGTTDQFVLSAAFSADLADYGIKLPLAAHSPGIVLGSEFRKESLDLNPDENYQSGEGAGQGGEFVAISGDYHVTELFAEARIPLVEGAPYAEELILDAAYRYSDYDYGEYIDTWAFGLNWAINPEIRLRGSVQRAVRAPTVHDLFLPQRFRLFSMAADPCAGEIKDGKTALGYTFEECRRTGVTEAQWGKIQNSPAGQYNAKVGGDPELDPEEAKTWTAGIVLTPEFADGLSLTVDYYKIEIEGGIGYVGAHYTLAQCLENGILCDKVIRGIAGDLWVGSNSQGVACTGRQDEESTELGLSDCLSGHLQLTRDNLAIEKSNGVDVGLDFALDLGMQGELRFNNVLTHINALDFQAVDGAPVARCAGRRYCGPVPDLQNRLRVTWDTPWDVTASAMWRHTSAVRGSGRFSVDIPKLNYLDLAAVWQVTDKAKIYAGINNLTDREPPIVGNSTGTNGNTFPGLYDALGRYLFMGASMEF
ncbi:MAG: TonB-dependent receptor [Gammaproteobacteria bacterium]|nr:TonB-dependent receptor [Gammaproteobacteria bacterium]